MDRKSRTSRSANLDDTNEEVNLWKQICIALAKLEHVQKDTANVVTGINNIHTAVNMEQASPNTGIPTVVGNKLMEFYRGGIDLSNNESKIIHDIIEKVSVLIALRDASEYNHGELVYQIIFAKFMRIKVELVIDGKRKKRKAENGDDFSSIAASGTLSVSSKRSKTHQHILTHGTSVAARQPKQKDKNEEWILAVVISYNHDKNRYEVEDVDQDDFGQKQRYMLQPRNVIPIPNVDEAKGLTEINMGQDVLALYPGTTCFYRAKVAAPPSKNKDMSYGGNYKVQFEDDNNEYKYVMPGHVLEVPKVK
ncbi:SAGA-associated factor 29 homolog [Mucor ambiguus]|uniref:SAGA-associated factor 29 homolog n=1 Tax=Mucor ambiguus TaxID=91626 RepID=A0A0C9MSU7_9FUNG|nr:SAGA-associated factor 29 homolog [Mucor ambiguus]